MTKELKQELLDQGLTESEADFLVEEYGDMNLIAEGIAIYDSADEFMVNELESADVNTEVYPISIILEIFDPDDFVYAMEPHDVVMLPSGRIVWLCFN